MDTTLGWMFAGIAALFSFDLVPRWSGRFYPTRPGFVTRLTAPVIFGALAVACFSGFASAALVMVAVLGSGLILAQRRAKRVRSKVA
jgi:hypothetical protein